MFAGRVTPDGDVGWTPGTWFGADGGYETPSGEKVNEGTAMAISAWYAGVNAISEDMGKLPVKTYQENADGSKAIRRDHPVYRLMAREPNPEMSAQSFRETMTQHALTFERGIAEIERDRAGNPIALWPLDPTMVKKGRDSNTGAIVHEIRTDTGGAVTLDDADVFEIHGLGYDGLGGYRRAALARYTLGIMLAAEKYQGAFFGNGTWLGGFVHFPEGVSIDALKVFRDQLNARHGGADKAHKIGIIPEGGQYVSAVADPEKATLGTLLNWHVEEVARWLRIPLPKLMSLVKANYNSLEALDTAYVKDTLTPWGERWKQEAGRKLFRESESDLFCEYVYQGLLQGDMAARTNYYQSMVKVGMTVNDVRRLENMNPIGPAGDIVFVDGTNLMPIDEAAKKTAPTAQAPVPQNNNASDAEAARPVIADAVARVMSKEVTELGRARDKYGDGTDAFVTWAGEWLTGHLDYVSRAIAPGLGLAARLCAGQEIDTALAVQSCVAQYAAVGLEDDREQMLVNLAMRHGIAAGLTEPVVQETCNAD